VASRQGAEPQHTWPTLSNRCPRVITRLFVDKSFIRNNDEYDLLDDVDHLAQRAELFLDIGRVHNELRLRGIVMTARL